MSDKPDIFERNPLTNLDICLYLVCLGVIVAGLIELYIKVKL